VPIGLRGDREALERLAIEFDVGEQAKAVFVKVEEGARAKTERAWLSFDERAGPGVHDAEAIAGSKRKAADKLGMSLSRLAA
jgi:hypothetical protein